MACVVIAHGDALSCFVSMANLVCSYGQPSLFLSLASELGYDVLLTIDLAAVAARLSTGHHGCCKPCCTWQKCVWAVASVLDQLTPHQCSTAASQLLHVDVEF